MITRTCLSQPSTTSVLARLFLTAGQPFYTKITICRLKRRLVTTKSQRPDQYFAAPVVCRRFIPPFPPRATTRKEPRLGPLARPAREVKRFLWTAGMASTALLGAPGSGHFTAWLWRLAK